MPHSVLFVCMGNICRSPTGEGVLRKVVSDRRLDAEIEIDSAGTIGYHTGSSPDARMTRASAARGYALESKARQIVAADLERFDLIIAMDRDNLSDILALDATAAHGERIMLLSDFLPDDAPRDVPDPYYGGEAGFEAVLDMIEQACDAIIAHLQRKA